MDTSLQNTENIQPKPKIKVIPIVAALFIFVAAVAAISFVVPDIPVPNPFQKKPETVSVKPNVDEKVVAFTSKGDFLEYLEKASETSTGYGVADGVVRNLSLPTVGLGLETMQADEMRKEAPGPSRVSETNVQVAGVDEPDVVKTDGKNIFVSSNLPVYRISSKRINSSLTVAPDSYPYPQQYGSTKVIGAFPPEALKQLADIEDAGELLLDDSHLVVLHNDNRAVTGYTLANLTQPKEAWTIELEEGTYLQTARMYDGKLYIITSTQISYDTPCPIRPLLYGGKPLEIACTDIHHPVSASPSDTTFTVLVANPADGNIQSKISFVGSANQSVIYMSKDNLYITHSFSGDLVNLTYLFLSQKASDLVSDQTLEKIRQLAGYDLSHQAKMTELSMILNRIMVGIDSDKRLQLENEFNNRFTAFSKEHLRDFEVTGITRVNLGSMKLEATGTVPGHPLNQFSLDEHNSSLRIATTIQPQYISGLSGFGNSRDGSANDVYVLDKKLNVSGKVTDLGIGERIYAVRFIGDMGYVVTFRETDPLYVLDLKNPNNPQKAGELKIPGYSSYLHQLADGILLGVGKEGSQVKLSLFNVKDPANPQEIDVYQLKEYWSEAVTNHHAFLQDPEKSIFFIPGGEGGYIFSYKGNTFSLVKAISKTRPKRALYIDNYLYLVGDEQIEVLDESSWDQKATLKLTASVREDEVEPTLEPVPLIPPDDTIRVEPQSIAPLPATAVE